MIRVEDKDNKRVYIHFPGGYVICDTYDVDRVDEHWYDKERRLHRSNGLPAVVGEDGYESYWEHGEKKTKRQKEHEQ